MEQNNTTSFLENASTTRKNISHSAGEITSTNIVITCFFLMSLLVGVAMNGLLLWVLAVKMKRTVNSLWFLHLVIAYLISSSNMPFLAVYVLHGASHWIFGTALCKLINFLGSVEMFTTIFLLTIISLDRYLLISHPIWCQHHRTIPRAWRVIAAVWLASLALSAPYLAFRETQEVENGKIVCVNNYALSSDWDGAETKALRKHVHLSFFVLRFLLAFLLPFLIIMGCYYWMGHEMKKKRLVRTKKPYRVLVAAVASFFICWLPYHLFHGALLQAEKHERMVHAFQILSFSGACFNFCITPLLYVFVGEKFQQVFKLSLLALLKRSFVDEPILP